MTIQECIKRLDSTDCWDKDVQALDMAIEILKSPDVYQMQLLTEDEVKFLFGAVKNAPVTLMPAEPETGLPELVTEMCPHCESEVTLEWNVEERGYKAFCPVCGGRLMLCDECQHRGPGGEHTGDCDYNAETDSCRFNPPEVESL